MDLANVIWMSVRGDVLTKEDAPAKLRLAARLGIHSVSVRKLWQGTLQRALESGVAVYDTLFVELADREQLPLATFDKKVLTTCTALLSVAPAPSRSRRCEPGRPPPTDTVKWLTPETLPARLHPSPSLADATT